MKYFYISLVSIILIYLLLLTFIYFNQEIFYTSLQNNYLDDPAKFEYEEVYIKVDHDIF